MGEEGVMLGEAQRTGAFQNRKDLPVVRHEGGRDSFPMEVWMSLRREVGVMKKLNLDKLPKMALEYERMEELSPARVLL